MPLQPRSVHIDRPLSDLSVAYFQERPPIADEVFPTVPVDNQSDSYYVWDKSDFWRDDARARAPGDKFARIEIRLSTDNYRAKQFALEYKIPDETVANADAELRLKQSATRIVTNRLIIRKDVAFADRYFKTGVWGTDMTGVSAAPNANQFLQWSDVASDPVGDIQTGIEALYDALGEEADDVQIVGLAASAVRAGLRNHPDIVDRLKYSEKADSKVIDNALAGILGLDKLVVARRRKTSSPEGASVATYANVFGKGLLLVAVPTVPAMETPSAGYTFEWNAGHDEPQYVEDYRDETVASDIIRGVTHFDQKVVAPDLGYFFSQAVK